MMPTITVCTGRSCSERYSKYVLTRLRGDKDKFDKDDKIAIEECMCRWQCKDGPVFLYDKELFTRGNPVKASEVFLRKLAELARQKKPDGQVAEGSRTTNNTKKSHRNADGTNPENAWK